MAKLPHRILALGALALAGCDRTAPLPEAPTVALSADRLTFTIPVDGSGAVESQGVVIRNAGPGALAVPVPSIVFAAYDQVPGAPLGWLGARVTAFGDGYLLEVQPSVSADDCWLRAGDYVATVVLDVPGAVNSPRTVQVALHVPLPRLTPVPGSLTFAAPLDGSDPAEQSFVARSRFGLSRPAVSAIGIPPWLSVATEADPSRLDSTVVRVKVLASILAPGSYSSSFTVYPPDGATAQVIEVAAEVRGPAWTIGPSELRFVTQPGADPAPAVLAFHDSGRRLPSGPAVQTSDSWLVISDLRGSWPSMQFVVAPRTSALLPGTYQGWVELSMAGFFGGAPWLAAHRVPVTVQVLPYPPRVSGSASFQAFPGGPDPAAQVLRVLNPNPFPMPIPTAAVNAAGGWLSASVSGAQAPYAVELRASVAGLSPGSYAGNVVVSVAGFGEATVFVTLLVADWVYTGPMVVSRFSHSASSLPDGRVLVAGGNVRTSPSTFEATGRCEIYDPASDAWTEVGGMGYARAGHSATALLDGRVLLAGGLWGTGRAAFEIYDPGLGAFAVSRPLLLPRSEHVAALLADGRVLLASEGSAELFDPSTDTTAATGAPAQSRTRAAAVRLRSGKVLVAGGLVPFAGATSSAELYDPATGQWTPTGAMARGRVDTALVLLPDGRALAVGGYDGTGWTGAELYDEATGRWSPAAAAAEPDGHSAPAVVLPGGKVLASPYPSRATEVYDPATDTWASAGVPQVWRGLDTLTVLPDGRILLVGGDLSPGPGTAELHRVIP